jgi:hypothetical protein
MSRMHTFLLDILTLEDQVTMLSQNIRNQLLSDAASYPRRMDTSATLMQKKKKNSATELNI